MTSKNIAKAFTEALKLEKYKLCGVYFSNEKPANSLELKKKGNGCIVPLILKASTGVPLVVAEESTGWPCSAFYLGFQDTIFEGIECAYIFITLRCSGKLRPRSVTIRFGLHGIGDTSAETCTKR